MSGRNCGVSSHACNRRPGWAAAVLKPHSLLAIAVLCGGLFATPAAAQWAASDLFPNPPVPTQAGPHGLEGLAGVADTAPVARGLGRLRLKLPGGGTVELARDGFERRKDGDVTWRGRVTDDEGSRAILTVKDGYMAGRILHGLDEYEIRPGPGRSHIIERIDGSVEPVEELVEPNIDYSYYSPNMDYTPSSTPSSLYGNSPDNIQLMAVYTPLARAAAGGTPQIEVQIQSMVDLVNTAFIDSGMIARIALIHAEEIIYTESGHVGYDLEWLSEYTRSDSMNTILVKRIFYSADLLTMIVDNGGRCAGAAYVMNTPHHEFMAYALSVSALSCGGGGLAHEIGHNMGFEHNREDSLNFLYSEPTATPYSFGHYADGSFRTIMSYPSSCLSGCPMAFRFSNPDLEFLGLPTGVVDQRDNARTGDLTAPIVTDFMDAVMGAVVNRRVATSVEDVEELADGSVVFDSTTLELGDGLAGVQAVGLRFQNLHIPSGMRIDSAYLEFEAVDIGSDATSVQIRAEAADNAPPFSATPFDVTGRTATTASVQWDLPAWNTVTEKHYSPDISVVIQQVVDRPGWAENNSMVITVGGTGIRTALAHDGDAASAPLLHVEYSSPDQPVTAEPPVAVFSASCASLTCSFTDQSTDSDGTIVSWFWNFGFLSYAEQNPVITFPSAGTYEVSLQVIDDQGWGGEVSRSFTVSEAEANIAPVAAANYYYTDNDRVLSGNVLTDGTPDSDFDGDPLAVTANTNSNYGTLSIAPNGDFTFTSSYTGSEYFFYTISDGRGGTDTTIVRIEVGSRVVADFSYQCIELACSFVDASTSPDAAIASWYWTFYSLPDKLFEQNPTYIFPGPGTYKVSLRATDSTGNASASASKLITVGNNAPTADFSYSCTDLICSFTDESTDSDGSIASWSWSFGDGADSSTDNPWHGYDADGTYTVNLTVTDNAGASDTATQSVTVTGGPVGTGDIVMAPASYDFGSVPVGTTQTANLAIQNLGDGVLTVSGLTLTGGNPDFAYNGPAVPFSVLQGTQVTFEATYTPSTVGPAVTGTLTFTSDDPDQPISTVTLDGTGEAGVPDITLSTTALDFGSVTVGTTQTATLYIKNLGTADLSVSALSVTGAEFALGASYTFPITVGPSSQITVPVDYTPAGPGPATTGSLDITSNAGNPSVTLDGTGVAGGADINLTPAALDFGTVAVGSSRKGFAYIQNLGTAVLNVSGVSVSGSDFVLENNPGAFTLNPNRQIKLRFTYTASAAGLATETLTVNNDSPGEEISTVTLTGTGEAAVPSITLSTTALDFGSVTVGTTQTGSVVIQNLGTADLSVSALSVTGAEFALGASYTFPITVGASSQITVPVDYTPAGPVPATTGSLDITSNAGNPSVTLDGTGVAVGADINLTPAALDFGTVAVGSSTKGFVYIQNLGTGVLNVSGVSMSGSDFVLENNPGAFTLSPNRQFKLRFTYTASAAGLATETLTVNNDSLGEETSTVTLTGTGEAAAPSINLTTTALDFGSVDVGTTQSGLVYIQNLGTADLSVSALSVAGAEFALGASYTLPITVGPSSQVRVLVDYTPAGPVPATTGSLDITSTAGNPSVTLDGTGVAGAPSINLTTTALDFGSVTVGTTQSGFVYIQNLGTADLSVSALSVTGAEFTLGASYTLPITVGPSSQVRILVDYTPAGPAPATTGSLDITSTAGNPSVSLDGAGVAGTPDITLSTTAIDFGSVEVDATQTATLYIKNFGTADLSVSALSVIGAEFTLPGGPYASFTVAPSTQAAIPVNYTAGGEAPATGSLDITSDAGNPSVTLDGVGVAPGGA